MKSGELTRTQLGEPVSQRELSNLERANVRLLGEVRVALIVAAILVLFQVPPRSLVALLLILGPYTLFSAALLRGALQRKADDYFRIAPWIDAAAYGAIVALSGGLESRFAIFLLFPALTISFERRLRPGKGVAIICTLWLVGITVIEGTLLQAEAALGPITAIFVVALVLTRWAIFEVTTTRRLALGHDLNRLFTPRHGLHHGIYELTEMLRAYHEADAGLMVMNDGKSAPSWLLYEADASNGGKSARGEQMDGALAKALLAVPADCAVIYHAPRFFWQRRVADAVAMTDLTPRQVDPAQLEGLANLLETRSFVTVPVRSRDQTIGRLYLTSQTVRYDIDHLRFLEQTINQAGLMIENMRLVERLTMEVANEERKKISRDLHDGTIQPYIGLKLGLEALARKVPVDTMVAREVRELIVMAADGINQLRHYVGQLKKRGDNERCQSLLPAVRVHAAKFSQYYGIDARVAADTDITVSASLFEQLMFIVREGLSNIRRHTASRYAALTVHAGEHSVVLEFVNDNGSGDTPSSHTFFPKTMGERAKELGGRLRVEQRPGGETAVTVEIPI